MIEYSSLGYELAIGCVVGFTIGLTGVGGGVLAMPALTALLGMPATAAVGTASAYASMTNGLACVAHWRQRNVQFGVAKWFLTGAIPGNIAACLVIGHLKATATDAHATERLQANLKAFVAGVMVFSVMLMIANLMRDLRRAEGQRDPLYTPTPAEILVPPAPKRLLGVLLGSLVGAIIGATSVGGGVIIVPLLIICFGLSMRHTVGTSTFIALVLTLCTALLSAGRGDVHWTIAGLMSIGSVLGVQLGSRLSGKLPDRVLQGAVIILLAIAIIGMLLAPAVPRSAP